MFTVVACSSAGFFVTLIITSVIALVMLLTITALEYKILYPPFKASYKGALKYFGMTNLIATIAGGLIAALFRQLEKYEEIDLNNGYTYLGIWFICLLLLIITEFFLYKKKHNDASSLKLSISLFLINVFCYSLFSFFVYFAFYLSEGQRMSRRIACYSNLKSIGLVLKQYAIDHDGWLPDKPGAEGLEQLRSNDYLTDYGVYLCPTTITQKGKENQPLSNENVDYIYRSGLKYPPIDGKGSSKIPVLWDKPNNHNGYGNVLFLDGHAKGFKGANWMEQAGINKTAATTEPNYSKDGKFYLNGILYTGPITVYHAPGKKWTELSYKNGVPEGYLIEWDKKGNLIGKRKIVPQSVEYQWRYHRRHLELKPVNQLELK